MTGTKAARERKKTGWKKEQGGKGNQEEAVCAPQFAGQAGEKTSAASLHPNVHFIIGVQVACFLFLEQKRIIINRRQVDALLCNTE